MSKYPKDKTLKQAKVGVRRALRKQFATLNSRKLKQVTANSKWHRR
jgi:hypothetical protein